MAADIIKLDEMVKALQKIDPNVNKRSIRYWTDIIGMDIATNKSGWRQYTKDDLDILKIVYDLKMKGLSSVSIKNILIKKKVIEK